MVAQSAGEGSGVFAVYFEPQNKTALKDLEFGIPNSQADAWNFGPRRRAIAVTQTDAGLAVVAGGGVIVFEAERLPSDVDVGPSSGLSKVAQSSVTGSGAQRSGGLNGRIVPAWTLKRGYPLNLLDIDLEKRLHGEGVTELSQFELEAFRPVFAEAGAADWIEGPADDKRGEAVGKGASIDSEGAPSRPNVWFCQYRPGDNVTGWTSRAEPNTIVPWKTADGRLPEGMRADDPVVYWRTIHPENRKDRGGIVGTGHVDSIEVFEADDGVPRFNTVVHEFFEDTPIARDDAIRYAGIDRGAWYGSILDVSPAQAEKIDALLQQRGRRGLFLGQATRTDPDRDGQITIRRDDAEIDYDALGRAPLAVSLAWTLHEIWCTGQGLSPYPKHRPRDDAPGFVAHIDAPWGGGKTSFANLVARVLNPDLDGERAEFLHRLYPERGDLSGLFISGAHESRRSENPSGISRWEELARQPWIIVQYNAWLHQHVDPPWWSFYQAIRKGCFKSIRVEGIPLVCQKEDGARWSFWTRRESRFGRYRRWLGLWLRELWWRAWTPKVKANVLTFCVVVLLAIVLNGFGLFDLDDVKKSLSGDAAFSFKTFVPTVVLVLLGGASALWSVISIFTQSLLPGTPEAAKNYSLGSADPFARFRDHFRAMLEMVRRPVLVVIDDIDRCEPKFIVGMTRGLQTILKSPRVVYLLLGDRKWIEQAFDVFHTDMKDIDVGAEHTFGGRFVEKAIQLSYVLPAMGAQKERYVRDVLTGRWSVEADRAKIREDLSNPVKASAIDEIADAKLENDPDGGETQRVVREEVILSRAANKEVVEQEIRHRLQPLARFLPDNPRHVKRIINAISMYQNSIVLTEDYETARFGGEMWRRLVVGVVAMIGFSRSWSILARDPDLATCLLQREPPADSTEGLRQQNYEMLSRNETFRKLLAETELWEDDPDVRVETRIDAEAVRWLTSVIPAAG